MNRKWWKLIYMLPITFCTLYAGGYVAQFIRNYQTWNLPAILPETELPRRSPPRTRSPVWMP